VQNGYLYLPDRDVVPLSPCHTPQPFPFQAFSPTTWREHDGVTDSLIFFSSSLAKYGGRLPSIDPTGLGTAAIVRSAVAVSRLLFVSLFIYLLLKRG